MATQDKLLKSLEQLKQYINQSSAGGDVVQKKKEKIQHCNLIVEAIHNPSIKVAKNYVNLLSFTIEILLQLCDDSESDIRTVADECLNKIIRGMNNINISKIQIELLKAIKQNGSARSLRAALVRFSILAHFIRPQKGKGYVTNVIPVLVKVFARSEEAVHETLASSLPDIMRAIGPFAMDYDIKDLLKACLNNVQNSSTVLRRMTASCALTICLHSHTSFIFLCYVFNHLLDLLMPPQETQNHLILGALGCIKSILPHLNESERKYLTQCKYRGRSATENLITTEKIVQLYELCLYFTLHKDHNIVNCALESLNVLLTHLNNDTKTTLLSRQGISKSRVFQCGGLFTSSIQMSIRSPSQASVATTMKSEENLLLDSDLTDFVASDIEKWIDESKLSVINVNYVKTDEDKSPQFPMSLAEGNGDGKNSMANAEYSKISIGTISNDHDADSIRSESVAENMDKLILSEESSEKSFSKRLDEEKSTIVDVDYSASNIDVGNFTDADVSLVFCTRFIAKQFLLSGADGCLISGKKVRVSTKNLALTCISTIIRLHPHVLVKYLDKNDGKDNDTACMQRIADILLYENHEDPQIRGVVREAICNFLSAVLTHSFGEFNDWLVAFADFENVETSCKIDDFIQLILKGLQDESSTCTRQCLISLNSCLSKLLESKYSAKVIPLLNYLPLMAKDPYWLVKVRLLELLTSFHYVTVQHVTGSKEFQNKVIHNVTIELLKDEDQRVRNAASNAIIKIVPLLYFEADMPKESRITFKALLQCDSLRCPLNFENSIDANIKMMQHVQNLPFPFYCDAKQCRQLSNKALARIVNCLYRKLITQSNKYYTLGCIETLCGLSFAYPVTVYRTAWNCFKNFTAQWEKPVFARNSSASDQNVSEMMTSSKDLLSFTVNLLTHTTFIYDLNCHMHLIKLIGNLFSGKCLENLRSTAEIRQEGGELWHLFTDNSLRSISEEYLTHLIKILNIYTHVIEEHFPILPQAKTTLPNLPSASALSPIKRRKSDLAEKRILSPSKMLDKDNDKEKKPEHKTIAMGYFASSAHYMKIYDIVKVAYNNYKATLSLEASENFLNFLRAVLYSMCQILEVATLKETGRIAEELLSYFKSTFALEPTTTVQCVQQLLKSLFDTNISSDPDAFLKYLQKSHAKEETSEDKMNEGFFYHIAHIPISSMFDCIGRFNQISKNEFVGDSIVMGYVHRKENKKIINKNLDEILANYIRIFEPMVIKSLKHYTMTSDVKLQAQVLQLLSQLVLLKVNYCLLDSEQIFIDFVLKQFQFMDAGQISFANELIPKIFQFLVHLSYGKQHTKSIIVIPKIIQLCDDLMASGQSPRTHCIPALKPIVEDVFLQRNKSNTADFKELETTREVLVSSMLKLIEFADVIDLLAMILSESKYCENTERWPRWSKQIFDTFLAQLRVNKIELERPECMNAAKRLLFALHPNVFRPLSYIFIALFEEAIDIVTVAADRFLAKLNLLLLITSQLNENKLLLTIEEVQVEIPPHAIFEKFNILHDPLNVSKTSGIFDGIMPEIIVLKFLFRTINITARFCVQETLSEDTSNLQQQLHQFLTYCLFIFQSGTHKKITQTGIRLINGELNDTVEGVFLEEINKSFLQLRPTCPLLTFQWCYILTLLNYNERSFWSSIIQITDNFGIDLQIACGKCEPEASCINKEIVRIGGSIVFADYLSEQILTDGEQMSWFLVNNIELIVDHHDEPPIYELLGSIHRNAAASGLLIQAISFKCLKSEAIARKAKILDCLENIHDTQTGNLLLFLLPKMLNTKILAICRQTANIASRKIEYLLTLTSDEVTQQLPKEELMNILDALVSLKLVKKHETLIGLLNKLSSQFYDLSPLEFDERRSINPEYIKNLHIDNAWYNSQVKQRCLASTVSAGYAEVLSKLSHDELAPIMNHKDFNKKIFQECFTWCRNRYDWDAPVPELLLASSRVIIKNVNSMRSVLPNAHHVYKPIGREASHVEQKYSNRLTEILNETTFYEFLMQLIPCVSEYMASVSHFSELNLTSTYHEDFTRFAVVCLEIVSYHLDFAAGQTFDVHFISACLHCAEMIVKETRLCDILALNSHIAWLCSAINSLYKFVNFLLLDYEPLPTILIGSLKETFASPDTQSAGQAVHQLHVLICWLETVNTADLHIPSYLMQSITSIIISLARLPLANSYILTPPTAWKSGWRVQLSGPFRTQVPPLPLEYMQEVDILEEFIFRIILLGWTSRTQFEETWVSLLSALSAAPEANEHVEDLAAIVNCSSLAVQAMTAILLQTVYSPEPGNKCLSSYIHVPRDEPFTEDSSPTITKLRSLHLRFAHKLLEYPNCLSAYRAQMNVFEKPNVEKTSDAYSFSQLSLEYLRQQANIVEVSTNEANRVSKICSRRSEKLRETGIDLRSCLQFQLDLFSQWLTAEETVHLRLLHEIVKSVIQTSDIFNDRSQFQWMLDTCIDLSKTHPSEDEIIHQYLVIAVCKASAVLRPDREVLDYVRKLIAQSLKDTFLPSRIAGLHGLLYILQMCVKDAEEIQHFLPVAVEYIEYNISSQNAVLQICQEHTLLVWALVFYVLENVDKDLLEESFVDSIITTLLNVLADPALHLSLYLPLIKGIERLIIQRSLPPVLAEKVTKYASAQFKRNSPVLSLPAAQLLFSSLYIEYAQHINELQSNQIVPSNPDHLAQSAERISAIFDKIKKGYPFEVDLLSQSLSDLLIDIFSPADILTKVISEFLSQHQRHPMQLCKIVFNVFESAIQQYQLSLLQDWVVFSLNNFTQSFSIGMATWCLTCFFISASNNIFLRHLFPYVQRRMGRYEYEDRKFLCIAGSDFYKNLSTDTQKRTFLSTLLSVKDQPDTPFNELLLCL